MLTSAVILLFLIGVALGWTVDWAIVRWIIIPAVFAIWHVTLPFWPVMGLFLVISSLIGSFRIKIGGKE